MNAKKRPSVIVMKRLDTQGMRVLSQSAGEGTRRAGVRLSPKGGLLVHRRGEPITSAPPPPTSNAAADGTASGREVDPAAPTMLAPVTILPNDVRAFARAALEEQIRESRSDSHSQLRAHSQAPAPGSHAMSDAPIAAPLPLPALRIQPSPRRSLAAWSIALVTLGLLTGVTIARIVGSAQVASGAHASSEPGDPHAAAGVAPMHVAAEPGPAMQVSSPATTTPSAAPIAVAAPAPAHHHHHASKPVQTAEDSKSAAPNADDVNALDEDASATSALVREQLGNSL